MMNSTIETRDKLRLSLLHALGDNPNNQDLHDALDILDDLDSFINGNDFSAWNKEGLAIFKYGPAIQFYSLPDLRHISTYSWDGNHEDLGIMVEDYL